ncbi:hypothetical protein K488DRAFT_86906 [Vararia minispora EC-137]|uniref:Uncharacterized protein n=1 Tax=Vararia minispora EC-137 TaxID=1314806 RepID=A0ACB8QI82_9AGAM|nr:hypothetical protein K488DRAFT_86906 [Vararia minispora EC-137]
MIASAPQMPPIRPGRSLLTGGTFVASIFLGTFIYLQQRQNRKEVLDRHRPGVLSSWESRVKTLGHGGELPAYTENQAWNYTATPTSRRENNKAQHILTSNHPKFDSETGAISQPGRHATDRGDGLVYTKRHMGLVPARSQPSKKY